jgi:hypothetical protein|tara:strand:+ start:35 stop:613 length:579 start_codon:yes stop_codon:yes gene_type:complete
MNPEEQKKNRLRKLKYRSKYIELEHQETSAIFQEAKNQWVSSVLKYCRENDLQNPFVEDEKKAEEATETEEKTFSSSQIKDLYRKIVLSTHPDKNINKSEKEIKKMEEIYNRAVRAKTEKDVSDLISIAVELEIDVTNLDMSSLDLMENQLNKKEDDLTGMRKDIAWIWYYSDDKQREEIIAKICPKPDKEV